MRRCEVVARSLGKLFGHDPSVVAPNDVRSNIIPRTGFEMTTESDPLYFTRYPILIYIPCGDGPMAMLWALDFLQQPVQAMQQLEHSLPSPQFQKERLSS